jgi:hypothetical protein
MKTYRVSASSRHRLTYATGNSLPSSSCSRTTNNPFLHGNTHLERVPDHRSSQHGWRHEVFFDLLESFLLFCRPSELLLMFEPNQWQQRLHLPCKVRYKMTQVIYLTEQLLDVFLAHRFSNLFDGLNFLGVDLYAMFMYYKP